MITFVAFLILLSTILMGLPPSWGVDPITIKEPDLKEPEFVGYEMPPIPTSGQVVKSTFIPAVLLPHVPLSKVRSAPKASPKPVKAPQRPVQSKPAPKPVKPAKSTSPIIPDAIQCLVALGMKKGEAKKKVEEMFTLKDYVSIEDFLIEMYQR